MWRWGGKSQHLIVRTIKAKTNPETKKLFWLLFAGSRGSDNRIRIMSILRKRPRNTNQLSTELDMDYKSIQHHIKNLKENNLVKHVGKKYARTYLVSVFFEANESVFDEIVIKLEKRISNN